LEQLAAAMVGKPAAMIVPSGTMANLAALLTHCPRGTKALLGSQAHSYVYEAGGAAALGGVVMTPVRNGENGELELDELRMELDRPADAHFAAPALVALENTHNLCAGAAVELSHMAAVAQLAHRRGLPVHLDGARIFNAALALETTTAKIAAQVDTVSFCLSKGLACPVGSLLCGSEEFVARARRTRKALGGGMRQAGIIAAAGIVALDHMIDRLAEDHENARVLADGLQHIDGLRVRTVARRTNMVVFEIKAGEEKAARFAEAFKRNGVLIGARGPAAFRAVTHYGLERADIERVLDAAAAAARDALA
ncbi:MAG: GntG family PLP-dependent aldolase, partial [Candidatus Binataceae bacterium]